MNMLQSFTTHVFKKVKYASIVLLPVALSACGSASNGSDAVVATYTVTLTNVMNAQPLSPPAVILHGNDYAGWAIGSAASAGLEVLAESGSPTDFIAEATTALGSNAGTAPIGSGNALTLEVTGEWSEALALTVVTMLVNTNDAYAGTTGLNISGLEVGESLSLLAPIYDAGTETNSETEGTIPGPADGGEGFNAARETHDFVTRHPGVVTQDDDYAESVLTQAHKFDQGAYVIKIERAL